MAIDGKALRGTRETGKKTLVHMVSACAETNGLVLAQTGPHRQVFVAGVGAQGG